MPTEQQGVTLRVTLDDEATPQLAQIRQVLGGLGATSGSGSTPVVSHTVHGMDEFSEALGKLGREMLGVGKTAVELAKIMGPLPIALGTVAYQMQRTSEVTKSWAEQFLATGNAARMAGIGIGEFKGIIEGMGRYGVSADAAGSMIVRFTQAYGELMRVGSARRQELINLAGPEFAGNMMKAIQTIGTLRTDTEKLNYVRQIGENVYKNELARSNDQMLAAYKRNQVMLIFQTPELVSVRGRLEEFDNTTKDNMAAEAEAYQRLYKAQSEEETTRARIGDILKGSLAPVDTLIAKSLLFVESAFLGRMEEEEKRIREQGAWFNFFYLPGMKQDYDPSKPPVQVPGFPQTEYPPLDTQPGVQPLPHSGETGEKTDEHTSQLKRLTKNVEQILLNNARMGAGNIPQLARGGVVRGPTRALVGEAGPEAIINRKGTRIINKPMVTTLGTHGTEAVVPLGKDDGKAPLNNSSGVPNEFTDDVTTLAKGGANKVDIHEYLKSKGVNLSVATCAQFLSAVVTAHGGRIPEPDPKTGERRDMLASNWNTVGEPGFSDDPHAINYAIKQGIPVGQGDSHVTVPIPQYDAQGNLTGFLGRGVNQEASGSERGIISSHPIVLGDKKGQYAIRHQIPDISPTDAAFSGPPGGSDIPAMAGGGVVTGRDRPGPGRVPVTHTPEEIAAWQPYFTNPLVDIEQEMSAARSTAREDIANVGKRDSLGGNLLQAGKAAWSSLQYGLSPISAIEHTTLGRLAGGAVGGREAGNVVADIVSPFIPYTPSSGAASAIEHVTKVAQFLKAANFSEAVLVRLGLGGKAVESARQAYLGGGGSTGGGGATADIGSPMGEAMDRSVLDRAMGNQMLKVGTSGQMKIVHENAPAGTTVETDGGVFDGATKETTRMPMADHDEAPQPSARPPVGHRHRPTESQPEAPI